MKKIFPFLAIMLSAGLLLSGCKSGTSSNGHNCHGNTCTVGRNSNQI